MLEIIIDRRSQSFLKSATYQREKDELLVLFKT
nr:MAG TPA: hypothetical protein [Bacteriophage sp.]